MNKALVKENAVKNKQLKPTGKIPGGRRNRKMKKYIIYALKLFLLALIALILGYVVFVFVHI